MCQNNCVFQGKPIKTRNPQYNAIIERIHKTIGNIIRKFDVSNIINNNPWSGILAATMFAVRENYHTTLQASKIQLVFGRYTILNIIHISDLEHIWQWKQEWINRNNKRKNMRCNNFQYKSGEKHSSQT